MPYKNLEDLIKYRESIKIIKRICLNCGKEFLASKYKPNAKFCGKSCGGSFQGKINGEIIGNKLRGTGSTSYIKFKGQHLHRYLMEQKIGRKLESWEHVHHIDRNKFNNNIDNLQLLSREEHVRLHSTKNRKCKVDGCGLKHSCKGYCRKHYHQMRRLGFLIN